MVPRLETILSSEPAEQPNGPDATQVRAKDAAYLVIPYAPEQAKDELMRAVVGWYSVDFEGRSLAGDYSAEQVTRALGPSRSMSSARKGPWTPGLPIRDRDSTLMRFSAIGRGSPSPSLRVCVAPAARPMSIRRRAKVPKSIYDRGPDDDHLSR